MLTIGIAIIVGIIAVYLLIFKVLGLRVISSNEVAVVEKWWSPKGSLHNAIIALHGEAGYLPDMLRGGIHFKSAFMYKVHRYPLITVSQGEIAYIFARDGQPLEPEQTLGKIITECNNFQDVTAFLNNGGQRGAQRGILREGTYAINLAMFVVVTQNGIHSIAGTEREKNELANIQQTLQARNAFSPVVIMGGSDADVIGIVTVHDGPPIPQGEIIAPDVGNEHASFQNPEKFLEKGYRGKQLQVLTDGTYYINRLFATVEFKPKTVVPIGYVGVVTSFYGQEGTDVTGETFGHGQLVGPGCKGVLEKPLLPGKYAINTDACVVVFVPTTNIILKWNSEETGSQKYDQDLAEVDIITKDAFETSLPLSVVINIPYSKASWVVQRFGDIVKLINQSIDPLVSAYFKDVAQTKTLIELIQQRSDIRVKALGEMKEKFAAYNLELEEVLIGTPSSTDGDKQIENILTQLRARQIAEEQKVTYEKQREASDTERALKEAQANAENQAALTKSKISITIAENEGTAAAKRAEQESQKIVSIAKAEAEKTKLEGEAEADKESKIGTAKATAIKSQVDAYGGSNYRLTQEVVDKLSEAIRSANTNLVPQTVVNMGGGKDGSTDIISTLLRLVTLEKVGVDVKAVSDAESDEEEKK